MNQSLNGQPVTIPGPAGTLEALRSGPDNAGTLAVLCHPHPQFGGDMHDTVLGIAASTLEDLQIACLRFNFRGVGASGGTHSGGEGEILDLDAVIRWAESEIQPDSLLLGGYSFGAGVVAALPDPQRAARLLLIAPPNAMRGMAPPDADIPIDVIAGDADPYVDTAALAAWPGVRMHLIEGADHFFGGHGQALGAVIRRALEGEHQ